MPATLTTSQQSTAGLNGANVPPAFGSYTQACWPSHFPARLPVEGTLARVGEEFVYRRQLFVPAHDHVLARRHRLIVAYPNVKA